MIACKQLKPFCGDDPARPWLHAPFSRAEYTYATDGRIAVRVPRLPKVGESEKAPNAAVLFGAAFHHERRREWQAMTPLPVTNGEALLRVKFGPAEFMAAYLWRIAGLPNGQLSPGEDDLSPLRFRCEACGLLGLLMPLQMGGTQ